MNKQITCIVSKYIAYIAGKQQLLHCNPSCEKYFHRDIPGHKMHITLGRIKVPKPQRLILGVSFSENN